MLHKPQGQNYACVLLILFMHVCVGCVCTCVVSCPDSPNAEEGQQTFIVAKRLFRFGISKAPIGLQLQPFCNVAMAFSSIISAQCYWSV